MVDLHIANTNWDSEVTDTTISPFSDKLIMLHSGFLYSTALTYYGTGMASSTRADVVPTYSKTIVETMKGAIDWLTLMVKRKWLEKLPEAINRKTLTQGEK
jgi:hypothetical protein